MDVWETADEIFSATMKVVLFNIKEPSRLDDQSLAGLKESLALFAKVPPGDCHVRVPR